MYLAKALDLLAKVSLAKLTNTFGPRIVKNGSCNFNEPIFMIGCPRSGTSISAQILGSHPDIAMWSEAGRVWDNKHFYDGQASHLWESTDLTKQDEKRIKGAFYLYKKILRKERLLNKHPRNSLRIDYIKEIFPTSLFVHVVRHPIPVVESLRRRSESIWRSNFPFGLFCKPPDWEDYINEPEVVKHSHQWREIVKYVVDVSENYDDSFMTIKYENLCADPANEVKRFSSFSGLNSSKYPDNLKSSFSTRNRNFKAKNNLTEEERHKIWDIVQDTAKHFGYERDEL
ncbi:MAG: sulfotransferase [Candidatus Bipolaricaulia bacterium]